MDELTLPKDDRQCEEVLERVVGTAERERSLHAVDWFLCHHYLNGARDFTGADYGKGTLDVNWVDQTGFLKFRYEDIVAKFNTEVGRLMRMDLTPDVGRKNVGIEDMKNATIAQIALNEAMPPAAVEQLKAMLLPPLVKYGCMGLSAWVSKDTAGIDVVPPWELGSIPPRPLEATEVRGLLRIRKVPVEWIKELPILEGRKIKWDTVETEMVDAGTVAQPPGNRFNTFGGSLDVPLSMKPEPSLMGGSKTTKDQTKVPIAKMVEVWVWKADGHLKEYILSAGNRILHRKSYEDVNILPPIHIVTGIPTAGLFCRSFVSTMIPMNREIEYAMGQMFQNIQDMDAYGILCMPTTLGISMDAQRAQDGSKRLAYAPDYTVPELKPFNIAPANSGPAPINAIKVGVELGDRIANQPAELLSGSAPGRVDSNAAVGTLYEMSSVPLTPTVTSIAHGVSRAYAALLGLLPMAWPEGKLVEIAMLDDAMAGISLDVTSGRTKLGVGGNAMPSPDDVRVGIKSMYPVSKEQQKMELRQSLADGVIDKLDFIIQVRRLNVDIPVGGEQEWQNWRRAVLNNIVMFNDGVTPNQVTINDFDLHEVHLRVLQNFVARPEFYAASDAVRQKFTELIRARTAKMATYPDQLPYPEEAAGEEMAMQQAQQMGMQPPQPTGLE